MLISTAATMLLSAIGLHSPLSSPNSNTSFTSINHLLFLSSSNLHKPQTTASLRPLPLTASSSTPITTANNNTCSILNPNTLCHVTHTFSDEGEDEMVSSASAVVSAIRRGSTSAVDFVQIIEKDSKLVLPSPDFQRLCAQQLDLFRRVVHPDAILSVYVRPAGSYVMDRLELRRVTAYPRVNNVNTTDIVIIVGNFNIPTGLRAAEATLSSQQLEFVLEHRAVVFPMVKHPFVVGFLVAELPTMEFQKSCGDEQTEEGDDVIHLPSPEEAYALPSTPDKKKSSGIQALNDEKFSIYDFTAEQRSNAINISHTLAMAYVMDQKAILLQQSSWQNNIRMSNLVEQIRSPLSSIRTLSKMLSVHTKRSEISYDIVENILIQGDRIRDALQELQDAVYLTKASIVRYNEESLKKIHNSTVTHPVLVRSQLPDNFPRVTKNMLQNSGESLLQSTITKNLEMPMPPLALTPLQQQEGIRPCNVSEVLGDLVETVKPLAHQQQRIVELNEFSQSLQVAVEEPALRQALSNLIEGALLRTHVGGKVEIVSTGAPAGGALVVVDDDGPDMHYMTQIHSLTPFGVELFSENLVEDNMTWNFVAGLTVACEILESYGGVVRIVSPRITDAALGAGGTRVELWLPSFSALSDINDLAHEA